MFQRSWTLFLWVVCTVGSSVIPCDGVWGRDAVTVAIVFVFHGITYRTHRRESCREQEKI